MENIVETLLTPGSTPALVIRIVNGSCVALLFVLGYLIHSDYFTEDLSLETQGGNDLNFHLYVMMGLAAGLMVLINWFVIEVAAAKKSGRIADPKSGKVGGPTIKVD